MTLFYNDMALGYFVKRDPEAVISAIVPTVEVHVNVPLNHRAAYSLTDASGTPTSVNITSGLNVEIRRNSLFTIGVVAPTTGPRPFDIEAVALFNYRFGAASRQDRRLLSVGKRPSGRCCHATPTIASSSACVPYERRSRQW